VLQKNTENRNQNYYGTKIEIDTNTKIIMKQNRNQYQNFFPKKFGIGFGSQNPIENLVNGYL